jgi:hypothetical protein
MLLLKDRERIEDSGSGCVLLTGATGFVGMEFGNFLFSVRKPGFESP